MKCLKCGNELPENSIFCPMCGNRIDEVVTQTAANPMQEKLLAFFQDKLFLVLCILVSGAAVFSLFKEGLPLFHILFSVFLWLVFAKARNRMVDTNQMRNISGTVFASYVINWVVIGSLALSVLIFVPSALTAQNAYDLNGIWSSLLEEINIPQEIAALVNITADSIGLLLMVVFAVLLVICAVAAIINVLALRNIHKFAKSLYQSAQSGVPALQKVNTAKTWLLVLGVFSGIFALVSGSDFLSFTANGSICLAYILAYVLMKKYFYEQ